MLSPPLMRSGRYDGPDSLSDGREKNPGGHIVVAAGYRWVLFDDVFSRLAIDWMSLLKNERADTGNFQ